MISRLLLATSNQANAKEYCVIFAGLPFELTTLDQEGIDVAVSHTALTYAENATLKAITEIKTGH